MQGTEEKLSMNVPSANWVISQNLTIPQGLIAPYEQQTHDINKMLHSKMTIELHKQLIEEIADLCIKLKT